MLISSGIRDFRPDRAAGQLAQKLRHQPGISARRAVPPRPPRADQGTGLVLADSVRRPRRAGRHADDHLSARNAGNDHARRRRGAGQRRPVVPRRFGRGRDHFGRKLGVGDGPGGGDRVARCDRPERARPHAQGPAGDQQAHAGPAVRGVDEMGRRDRFGRDQGRRHPRADAARDRQGSRSDPRKARPHHPRRRRAGGFAQAVRGRGRDRAARPARSSCGGCRPSREIGVEHNSTIIAMLPVELVHAARKIAGMPPAETEQG